MIHRGSWLWLAHCARRSLAIVGICISVGILTPYGSLAQLLPNPSFSSVINWGPSPSPAWLATGLRRHEAENMQKYCAQIGQGVEFCDDKNGISASSHCKGPAIKPKPPKPLTPSQLFHIWGYLWGILVLLAGFFAAAEKVTKIPGFTTYFPALAEWILAVAPWWGPAGWFAAVAVTAIAVTAFIILELLS